MQAGSLAFCSSSEKEKGEMEKLEDIYLDYQQFLFSFQGLLAKNEHERL